jgi:threonylcarbamoyladenosine tRNA methylthiotransferase MtaB
MGSLTNTVALDTLGCKLNQAESESLGRSLSGIGYQIVTPADHPHVYILNTCTVTHVADRKSRHLLRLARRRNADCLIVAAGCYAERAPQDLVQMPEVDLTVDNSDKARLPDILKDYIHSDGQDASHTLMKRTRSFIKIQEGCDQFCSYCIVPFVRGVERSLPADDIVSEVKHRVECGYKEIVLTGTRIGSYHGGLENLIQRILSGTDVPRLRLSSLQAQEITTGLLGLWRDNRLCSHFHIPLQSGSDPVLERMGRRYTTADYESAVAQIREMIPDVAITTDIMVGLPGETGEEFSESYRFCQRMAFANIHVFQYSARPGTRAMHMSGKIDEAVKRERSEKMLRLAEESAHSFRNRFIKRTMDVLWERQVSSGIWSGLTGNYIRVLAQSDRQLTNECSPVRVSGLNEKYVTAELPYS